MIIVEIPQYDDSVEKSLETAVAQLEADIKQKIDRIDTKTFFLEPTKWVGKRYNLNTAGLGWTANSILQVNAPDPICNQILASGITIASQSVNSVSLEKGKDINDPVIITLVYCGEDNSKYLIVETVGNQTIKWTEEVEVIDNDLVLLVNFEGDRLETNTGVITDKAQNNFIEIRGKTSYSSLYSYSPQIFGEQTVALDQLTYLLIKTSKKPLTLIDGMYRYYVDFIIRVLRKDNAQTIELSNVEAFSDTVHGYYLSIDSPGKLYFYYTDTANQSKSVHVYSTTPLTNYHCRFIVNGNTIKIFMNGALRNTITDAKNENLKQINLGGYVVAFDEIRVKNGLPAIENENHLLDSSGYKTTKTVIEEHSKTIYITEKTWFERRSNGLFKYDKETGEWVKES